VTRAPRGAIPVETLRRAAALAVARTSLRRVAGQMKMAPSWLDGFLAGRISDLRVQTQKKLRDWYLREVAGLAEVEPETAAAALGVLVEGLVAEAERGSAAAELVAVLERAYARHGPLPGWLRTLLEPAR
jgi:hypothetical protein